MATHAVASTNAGRPLGRYYRSFIDHLQNLPWSTIICKIPGVFLSIELAKIFIEEARTVEKIQIGRYLAIL